MSELAGLCGKCEHDMQPIRVLQQVNTTARNGDRPEKPLLGRPGIGNSKRLNVAQMLDGNNAICYKNEHFIR